MHDKWTRRAVWTPCCENYGHFTPSRPRLVGVSDNNCDKLPSLNLAIRAPFTTRRRSMRSSNNRWRHLHTWALFVAHECMQWRYNDIPVFVENRKFSYDPTLVFGHAVGWLDWNRERKCAENYNKWHDKFIFKTSISISNHNSFWMCLIKLLQYILFEKYIYILALEIASPGKQHCANCIGTLSFPIIIAPATVARQLHDIVCVMILLDVKTF